MYEQEMQKYGLLVFLWWGMSLIGSAPVYSDNIWCLQSTWFCLSAELLTWHWREWTKVSVCRPELLCVISRQSTYLLKFHWKAVSCGKSMKHFDKWFSLWPWILWHLLCLSLLYPTVQWTFSSSFCPPQVSNSNVTVLGKGPETLQNMVLISCLYIDSLFLKVWLYGWTSGLKIKVVFLKVRLYKFASG